MKEEGVICRVAEVQSVGLLEQFISGGFSYADGSELCVFWSSENPSRDGEVPATRPYDEVICGDHDYAFGDYT